MRFRTSTRTTTLSEPGNSTSRRSRGSHEPKDAVKCERFARERWYSLEVDVALESAVAEEIIDNTQRVIEENRKAKALDSLDAEAKT